MEQGKSVFKNAPALTDNQGNQQVKRYSHTPLTLEHFGIQAAIQANGRVKMIKPERDSDSGDIMMVEIEVPASMIFNIAQALKLTRKTEYVSLQATE